MNEILIPIVIALITSVFGPVLLEWSKSKFKKRSTDPLPESIRYNEQIEHQLDIMLDELGCDQIFIAQFHNGGHFYPTGKSIQKFSIFYEVLSPNIESVKNVYQNIPVSLFNKPLSELYDEGEVIIEDAENNPSYLLNTTTGGKCKSIYLLALTDLDGRIIGVMGIHYIEKKHKIVKDEWIFIRQKVGAIGNIMSNYLHSKNKLK
jgi:hypothetical protein